MTEMGAGGRLAGRLALVTGAARGIGYGIAETLAREGARVVMNDIDAVELERAVDRLGQALPSVAGVAGNIADQPGVEQIFGRIREEHGTVDVLVNNAGRIVVKPLLEQTVEDWNTVIATNLSGTFFTCQQAIAGMIANDGGSIINISSLAAFHYTVPHAAYAASKAGVVAMTRELAYEFGPANVRVNAIAPGAIASRMTGADSPSELVDDDISKSLRASVRIDRWGRPEDVGKLVAFLASDDAGFITGTVVTIAGGSDLKVLQG